MYMTFLDLYDFLKMYIAKACCIDNTQIKHSHLLIYMYTVHRSFYKDLHIILCWFYIFFFSRSSMISLCHNKHRLATHIMIGVIFFGRSAGIFLVIRVYLPLADRVGSTSLISSSNTTTTSGLRQRRRSLYVGQDQETWSCYICKRTVAFITAFLFGKRSANEKSPQGVKPENN